MSDKVRTTPDPRPLIPESPAPDRLRSQILGILVLALIILLIACLRYYLKLG